jgi:glucokinase
MVYTLAADIGGTKIAAGVMNEKNDWISEVKQESDGSTPERMYDSLLSSIYQAIKRANLTIEQIDNYGITIPGQVDVENGIAVYQNNLPWRNFPLGELLREKFPDSRIVFEHDVVAAALGEWSSRNLLDELFVYITVSTGLSASIIYKGLPLRGTGFAGEIGFFPVKDKTLETYASGSAMEKELLADYGAISLANAMNQWQKGDRDLADFFNEKAYQIAVGIYNVTSTLDPHKIVLGGGVISNQVDFYQLIKVHYQTLCNHPIQKNWVSRIERSVLQGKSGLYGVAMKACDSL